MKRMKENYEMRSRSYLTRRTPVILRIDGKAFHTYTRGLEKPFDSDLVYDMMQTTVYLCSKIQGAKCGYAQSDEISILLTDYDNLNTSAWFDYEVQKMCSVAASHAASYFNQLRFKRLIENYSGFGLIDAMSVPLADFDCRAFNLPKEEVANYFLARQKDAVKNSISMLAQSLYSHKELHGMSTDKMQEMCFQKGHNWNDLHYAKKRGSFIVKETLYYFDNETTPMRPNTLPDDKVGEILSQSSSVTTRTSWGPIETPFTFSEENFKQWL